MALTDDGRPRFLADEGFNRDVTAGLRRHCPELDIVTVQEVRLTQASDPRILEAARQLDRIILSHDVRTMPIHFFALLERLSGTEHLPGILLVSQRAPVGNAIQWIAEVWGASQHHE